MMKLNKIAGSLLAGLMGLALMSAPVKATEAANSYPADGTGAGFHTGLSFMGLKVKRIVKSSSDSSLVSGAGFLDAICVFQGTLGKYSQAYDTNDTAYNGGVANQQTYAISPQVFVANDSTSAQHGQSGCWVPPAPIKFINGLYGEANDSGHTTLYYVHCADGDNPCAP